MWTKIAKYYVLRFGKIISNLALFRKHIGKYHFFGTQVCVKLEYQMLLEFSELELLEILLSWHRLSWTALKMPDGT